MATFTTGYDASDSKQSVMIRAVTSGRAASWISTRQGSSPSVANAATVLSLRVAPPSTTWVTLSAYPPAATIERAASRCSAAITTVIASTSGCR